MVISCPETNNYVPASNFQSSKEWDYPKDSYPKDQLLRTQHFRNHTILLLEPSVLGQAEFCIFKNGSSVN